MRLKSDAERWLARGVDRFGALPALVLQGDAPFGIVVVRPGLEIVNERT
jgi:hypothetical protein